MSSVGVVQLDLDVPRYVAILGSIAVPELLCQMCLALFYVLRAAQTKVVYNMKLLIVLGLLYFMSVAALPGTHVYPGL